MHCRNLDRTTGTTGILAVGETAYGIITKMPGLNSLKSLQCCLLLLLDVEELVELGNLEHLVDVRVDVAQDELAAGGLDLLVQSDELAEGGTGEIFDIAEIEQDLPAAELVHQAEEIFADFLNVLLVEDFLVDEVDDGDI